MTATDDCCPYCDKAVLEGQGYLVYSEASQGIAADQRVFFSTPGPGSSEDGDHEVERLDVMLYCVECANALFTEAIWKAAKALRVDMAPADVESAEGRAARFEVISFGIVLRAKRRGLNAPYARTEARALAEIWSKDRDKARQAAKDGLVLKIFGGVLGFCVIAVGVALVLGALGVPNSTGIIIGLICWYAYRFFATKNGWGWFSAR